MARDSIQYFLAVEVSGIFCSVYGLDCDVGDAVVV